MHEILATGPCVTQQKEVKLDTFCVICNIPSHKQLLFVKKIIYLNAGGIQRRGKSYFLFKFCFKHVVKSNLQQRNSHLLTKL